MSDEGASDLALEKTVSAEDVGVTPGGVNVDSGRLATGTRLGRYQIVEFIGGGGMGWVYRAKDTELEREVAIKVVQPTVTGPKGRERLLAEARAMAKLRHRAVVPVHDVGEYAGGVYVAMALVKGGTLHDWMHAEPRPWRQVVARFLEAGRGLVAAHAAGIVHRDFKPRNVLLGEGGEVLVADFGIASANVEAGDGAAHGDGTRREATSIVGTPAYMAPEQAAGQAVDARADQYSFCVSLWEGLHGQRPQEAETRTQGALLAGATEAPKSRRRVPGWLTDAVARGFAPDPDKRWPTLAALLDRLERGLGRRRRTLLGVAATSMALFVAVAFALARRTDAPSCGTPTSVRAAWNPLVQASIDGALRAAAPGLADETLRRVMPALDAYSRRLVAASVATCRATRVEHSQSERLMDLRMGCLGERQAALRATLKVLSSADKKTALRAVGLVSGLPEIESCSKSDVMVDAPLLSEAQRSGVDALTRRLDASREVYLRGDYAAYLEEARQMADEARAIGYAPISVRALRVLNQALSFAEQDSLAVDQELARVAASAHDDAALVIAWANVIFDLHASGGDPAAAKALLPVLDAAIERAGGGRALQYRGALSAGFVALLEARYRDAAASFEQAVALADSDIDRYLCQGNVSGALVQAGDRRAAVIAMERAVAYVVTAYGEHHPQVALARATLARRQLYAGDIQAARASLEQAEGDLVETLGAKHPWLGEVYGASADLAALRGDRDEALRNRQLIVDIDNAVDQVSAQRCAHLVNLGGALGDVGPLERAVAMFESGLRCYEPLSGRDSFDYAMAESSLGQLLVSDDRCEQAAAMLAHAQLVLAGQAAVVMPLYSLAMCDYVAGRRDEAHAAVEKALAICERRGCPPDVVPPMLETLGGWLIAAGGAMRLRGTELSRDAARRFQDLGNSAAAARIEMRLANERKAVGR